MLTAEGSDEMGDSSLKEMKDKNTIDTYLKVFQNLSERDRLILVLYYYEHLTYAEIARLLGIPEVRVEHFFTDFRNTMPDFDLDIILKERLSDESI